MRVKADFPGYAQTFGLHIRQRVKQLHSFPKSDRKVQEDESVRAENSLLGTTGC